MNWYTYKGRRLEWYSYGQLEAPTAKEALQIFLDQHKFVPNVVEGDETELIAYRREQIYPYRNYYRVYLKEPGTTEFYCIAGRDPEKMSWIESIWADDMEQAVRRLVARHHFLPTHIKRRPDYFTAYKKGDSFVYIVWPFGTDPRPRH